MVIMTITRKATKKRDKNDINTDDDHNECNNIHDIRDNGDVNGNYDDKNYKDNNINGK